MQAAMDVGLIVSALLSVSGFGRHCCQTGISPMAFSAFNH